MVITANLKTLSNQVRIIVPYKVDTGSDGNIMPLHIYKNYFLWQQKNNWWQQEIKTYNRTLITQLHICKVKIEKKNKHKM